MKLNPSLVVNSQAPEFIRSDYAKFITFLKAYYEFLEQDGGALNVIRNLDTFGDIDEQTHEPVLSTFYSLFLPDFPQFVAADKKFVLKHIADFYNSKGSIDSVKAFFRILYGEEVQVYLPKVDILKLDTGIWNKVFKIKVMTLSAGLIADLNGCEIYQVDPINGNKIVRAKVIDYNNEQTILYLSADNVVLNFLTTQPVYSRNLNGIDVTFYLQAQLSSTAIPDSGLNYSAGESAIINDVDNPNTENIKIQNVSKGTIQSIVVQSAGKDYSIYDTVSFGTPNNGETPAKARIAETINNDYISEVDGILFSEPEDRLLFEDNDELKQEYGTFGSATSTPINRVADETSNNVNPGNLSSNEFGFLLESQSNDVATYSSSSYTYNGGLFRTLLPRVGATRNYSLNWARNEGISCMLQDEELWIGSLYSATGTVADPGTVIIQFETDSDYNNLEYYELTNRTSVSSTAPTIGVINQPSSQYTYLDSKTPRRYSLQQQIGAYDFGQDTLTSLYPFCENTTMFSGPIMYIRERNTLFGHDLNTTRPWEYRFVFRKNSTVRFKIYIMPTQYDLRSEKIILEDGSDIYEENDVSNILLQEAAEIATRTRVGFDPNAVASNQITVPSHGFVENQIIRYNTFTDIDGGIYSDTVGGIVDGEIFYCHVIDANTIQLIPYGTNSESLNYGLYRTVTPAATAGTTCYFSSFVGDHVTNGVDYTSSSVDDSAITINARKRSAGSRDLGLKYNKDPSLGTDPVTGLKYEFPYSGSKYYIWPALTESTEYIVLERSAFDNTEQTLALEIDKRSPIEAEHYTTYPCIALETSVQTVTHANDDINIPDGASVKVMVERKSLQMADDINRGSVRLPKIWNDFADISPSQELYNLASTTYSDEYDVTPYVAAALPTNASDYSSGPGEFANYGPNMFVAASKSNSVYYTDGTGAGLYKYAAEFDEQRRISFVETSTYDNKAQYPTARNAPLGITSGSSTAYNTNSKRFFTINFALPKELNASFDMPFEVNLTNIINSTNTSSSFYTVDNYEYVTLEGSVYNGEQVVLLENGDQVANELNNQGFNSLSGGNVSTMDPKIVLEFWSPSLAASNPKKHIVYYCNLAEYTQISSDVQRTIYSFYNCWSPNANVVPDTTVRDYNVVVKSLHKSDYIIEKVSDRQNLSVNQTVYDTNDWMNNHTPFQQIFDGVAIGKNNYGKYIDIDPINGVYGFGNVDGNTVFGSGVDNIFRADVAYNPINKAFIGAFNDTNVSLARYFDPATDISSNTITLNNHGLADGSWVRFRTDFNGSGPAELTDNTTYYVKVLTSNTFRLASSKLNYDSSTLLTLTPYATAGKTCTLQTIPQSLNFGSVKDLSFDQRKYVKQVTVTSVDTIAGQLTTDNDHTLTTLTPIIYSFDNSSPSNTVIGGLVANAVYYVIFVSSNQIKLATSVSDALAGIYVTPTSSGVGSQYIIVNGANGNLSPYEVGSVREQRFYTPGQYTNFLKNGDQVSYATTKLTPKGTSSSGFGSTSYVRLSTTGAGEEAFDLTTNTDLTSSGFGIHYLTKAYQSLNSRFTTQPRTCTFRYGDEIKLYFTGTLALRNQTTNVITNITSGTTLYVYRLPSVDENDVTTGYASYNFAVALSKDDLYNGIIQFISSVSSVVGTYIQAYLTNNNIPSEIVEVIPYSSSPNFANMLNPGITGTGIEEYTFMYSPTLQTETGKLKTIEVISAGSYKTIPNVSIVTSDGRTGSGSDVWPVVKNIGKAEKLEILDGGLHSITKQLMLPDSFFISQWYANSQYYPIDTFELSGTITVNGNIYGDVISQNGHYVVVQPKSSVTQRITYGDVIANVGSSATATVGSVVYGGIDNNLGTYLNLQSDSTNRLCLKTVDVFNVDKNHNYVYGDKIKIENMVNFTNGIYYVVPKTTSQFYITSDNDMTMFVMAGTAYVDTNTAIRSGVYTGQASASPGAITTSTENGSTNNYSGDKGLLNTWSKLQDSSYYQDYSYVVRGSNSHEDWKQYFNKLVHPAGMAVFGEVDYFSTNSGKTKLGNTTVVNDPSTGQPMINNTSVAITTTMTT